MDLCRHFIKKYPISCICIVLIWILSLLPFFPETPLFWAWLAPIAMSGVLELLQEYCTGGHRNGDWLDFAANATGVTLAAVIGLLILRFRART